MLVALLSVAALGCGNRSAGKAAPPPPDLTHYRGVWDSQPDYIPRVHLVFEDREIVFVDEQRRPYRLQHSAKDITPFQLRYRNETDKVELTLYTGSPATGHSIGARISRNGRPAELCLFERPMYFDREIDFDVLYYRYVDTTNAKTPYRDRVRKLVDAMAKEGLAIRSATSREFDRNMPVQFRFHDPAALLVLIPDGEGRATYRLNFIGTPAIAIPIIKLDCPGFVFKKPGMDDFAIRIDVTHRDDEADALLNADPGAKRKVIFLEFGHWGRKVNLDDL